MSDYSETVETAREYYNSGDADNFYFTIWGGEDIHIGLYESEDEPIVDASQRTVEKMVSKLDDLNNSKRAIDLGSGFGGSARYMARNFGCEVVGLNLSETQNERARQLTREQGLDHLVKIVDGTFEDVPYPDGSFDVVWSQDSFLHSGKRDVAIREAARLLHIGGELIFTDPMQADDCPEGVLQPILDRIHLESLGSPGFYEDVAARLGLELLSFEEQTHQLVTHYSRVLAETERREDELRKVVSEDYIQRMKQGLKHWVEGGRKGWLSWGIMHFRREK